MTDTPKPAPISVDHLSTAKIHRDADAECGRPWVCWCGSCKLVKTAAPELVDALKAFENVGLISTQGRTTDGRPCNCTCDVHPELLAALEQATNAIAKARVN